MYGVIKTLYVNPRLITKSNIIYLAAILNAAIVGFSFLFTKIALQATSPIDTLGYRFLIGWIVLTLYLKLSQRQKSTFKIGSRKNLLSFCILALFYPILFFSFQAFGLNFTTSTEGGIILAFSPALTALFAAVFIKEKINLVQMLFIFLSIFGVVFIFFMNGVELQASKTQLIGIILLVMSCVSISGYAVSARFLSLTYTPIQLTYVMVTFGMIFFNLYAIGEKVLHGEVHEYFLLLLNKPFIWSVLFLGIFATMLTAFLSNYVLSKITASKMSIFSNLSTIISIVAGAVFLKETITYFHIIGSIMIITGVLGTNLYKNNRTRVRRKIVS